MKATFTYSYMKEPLQVIHENVVETEKKSNNRSFKCLDCGLEWIENISSPIIITDEEHETILKNYKNVKNCKSI